MATVLIQPQPIGTTTPPPTGVVNFGPQPFRWTVAEYQRLYALGMIQGVNTILVHGEILVMPMPKPPHNTALALTDNWLRSVCPAGHYVRNQDAFDIGTRSDPGPDLAIVPGAIRDYTKANPTAAVLIVEVADSSLVLDTTTKVELYATAGVPEYWVIDLEHRQAIIFRDPAPLSAALGGFAYRTRLTLGPADTVSPLAAPHASILVADLLP